MAKSAEVIEGDKTFGNVIKLVGGGIIVVLVLALLLGCFVAVPAGSRAVLLQFRQAITTLPEGLSFKVPFIQDAVIMSVQTQKYETDASAASKDLQDVTTRVALNFHVEPDHVLSVYKNIGENYGERIIAPAVQESVKAVTAEFNAEELITKRPVVKEKIGTALADRLRAYGIITDALSITNFQFSSEFTSAIEQKVVAEQQALQAKNVLEQRKYEAQQLIETAKGNAEAMQINNEQLAKSDKVLLMRLIDKWNGVMPLVIVSGSGQSPGLLMNLAAGNLGAMNMTTAYQNASG